MHTGSLEDFIEIPLHISGFWRPVYTEDVLSTGSLGAGLVLKPMTFIKAVNEEKIYINSTPFDLEHLKIVKERYGYARGLYVKTSVPLGVGAGVSGNISIGLGYNLASKIYTKDLFKRIVFAGIIGHEIEVIARTGLGDVIAELSGAGIEERVRNGSLCKGVIINHHIKEDVKVLLIVLRERIYTPEMLKLYSDKFYSLHERAYRIFSRSYDIDSFIEASYYFSKEIGFLREDVDEKISSILADYQRKGDVLGYFIKKSLLIIIYRSDADVKSICDNMRFLGEECIFLEITDRPIIDSKALDEKLCETLLRDRDEILKKKIILQTDI